MVFQNYALYPHLSVAREHRVRPAAAQGAEERDRRARAWAAKMLDLTPYLDRRPKQLSGGQRQRVAMGRAIVRQPQVFLMDEPLSNLDAKLRVQMRADIAKLQHDLETTTIYVTHDQVEAMTMGDRVAVMSHGVLQQVDAPQRLYDSPGQPLRRRLHRHAADEPARGRPCRENGGVAVDARRAASFRLADAALARYPGLARPERPHGRRRRARRRPASRRPAARACRRSTARSSSSRRSAGSRSRTSRSTRTRSASGADEDDEEPRRRAARASSRRGRTSSRCSRRDVAAAARATRCRWRSTSPKLHFFDAESGEPLR